MLRKILFVVLFVSHALFTFAQDIHFSQYLYNQLNLSPASTGLFNGDVRANGSFRSQWNAVSVPYNTFSLAYEQIIGKTQTSGSRNAAGVVINDDHAGDGNFGTLQALISYAHLFSIGSDSIHFINAGIQTGISYRKVDVNKLTFDNQYSGDAFNALNATGEQFERSSYIYPEINIGIHWMAVKENANYQAGFSAQHLNKPGQSFLNENADLPIRWQMTAGTWQGIRETVSINPSILYMHQLEFNELIGGLEVKIKLKNGVASAYAVGVACHYRVDDAVVPALALYYNLWRFGLSYDVNNSSLKTASNGKGGPEFNVTYVMKKIKYNVRKNNCPVY